MESVLIKDGLLKPYHIKYTAGNFDIYKDVISKKRDKDTGKLTDETYERTKLVATKSTLESAIETVIHMRVTAGNKKVMTLINFYQNYKKIKEETEKIFEVINATTEERLQRLENCLIPKEAHKG